MHEGQARVRCESPRLRLHGAGLGHYVDEQVDHRRGGDEVEHDGRDDDVAASVRLQEGGHEGPGGAEESGSDHRHGHDEGEGRKSRCRQTSATPSPPM